MLLLLRGVAVCAKLAALAKNIKRRTKDLRMLPVPHSAYRVRDHALTSTAPNNVGGTVKQEDGDHCWNGWAAPPFGVIDIFRC